MHLQSFNVHPRWLSTERVGLMTCWLLVRDPFFSGVFSPLTSPEACEKSWKESCAYWCEKARKHVSVTDRHDMTLDVEVALNRNKTNQLKFQYNRRTRPDFSVTMKRRF